MEKGLTKNNESIIEIDLMEMAVVVWNQLWLLLLIGSIVATIRFGHSVLTTVPQYSSTTSIYMMINRTVGDTGSSNSNVDSLIGDYTALISGRYVLERVIEDENLNMTYKQLQSKISVSNQANTRILLITVRDTNPKMAQKLANAVREGAAKHIKNVTRVEAVNMVDPADMPQTPSTPSHLRRAMIAGAIAAFIGAAIIVVLYLLDDTISTEDDIMRHLELSTLATIPEREDEKAARKKFGKNLLPNVLMNLLSKKG